MEALSEKERGAFDVLMELKKTQINKREATAAHDVEKDAALALLQVGSASGVFREDRSDNVNATEQLFRHPETVIHQRDLWVVLTRLNDAVFRGSHCSCQMGSDAKQRDAEEAAKREQQLQKERATIAVEHDYFARPGPAAVPVINVDTDETDSADEGDKHQVPCESGPHLALRDALKIVSCVVQAEGHALQLGCSVQCAFYLIRSRRCPRTSRSTTITAACSSRRTKSWRRAS